MPRARSLAFAFASGAALWAAAGCTFLVSFDDVPAADDAGSSTKDASRDAKDGAAVVEDTGSPAVADSGPKAPVTPPCDTSFALADVDGCASFIDGAQACADNTSFTSYPGNRKTDVVTCSRTSGATCVRHCVACAHNPSGYPDQCDQCSTKPDGKYCGPDMAWESSTAKLLVTCSGGKMTSSTPCGTACASNGGTGQATCK